MNINATFGVSFSRLYCCGRHGDGLWPSWYRPSVSDFLCLSACLFVCQHNNFWTVRDIITQFSEHHPVDKRADKFENGYIEVHGW